MKYVSRDGQVIDVPAGGQVPPGFVPVGSGMSGGQSSGGADINVGNNEGMMIHQGRVVPIDRPQGASRVWAGLRDWASFGISDYDKQGNLTSFGETGSMHGDSGYGQEAKNIKTNTQGKVLDTQRGVDGRIIGTKVKEGSDKDEAKDPSFDDFYGMPFQEYLNKMEGIQNRAAQNKMLRGQIASIPDLMAAGNLAVAQANRDIAKASSEWGVALTKQKPWEAVQKWSPPTQFDYRLGS